MTRKKPPSAQKNTKKWLKQQKDGAAQANWEIKQQQKADKYRKRNA